MRNIKIWYAALTRGGDKYYSLSDTQFFWITAIWLLLLPAAVPVVARGVGGWGVAKAGVGWEWDGVPTEAVPPLPLLFGPFFDALAAAIAVA